MVILRSLLKPLSLSQKLVTKSRSRLHAASIIAWCRALHIYITNPFMRRAGGRHHRARVLQDKVFASRLTRWLLLCTAVFASTAVWPEIIISTNDQGQKHHELIFGVPIFLTLHTKYHFILITELRRDIFEKFVKEKIWNVLFSFILKAEYNYWCL